MKLFRYLDPKTNTPAYGILEDAELVAVEGDVFGKRKKGGQRIRLSEARVLAPVSPTKVVALGLNYKDHAREMGMPLPTEPIIFLKPSTSVIGPDENIVYPAGGITERVDYEAELGIVIGKKAKAVKAALALDHVLGFTCVNDVTARDLQKKDGQWSRAKGFDTFCPIGPCIETELDTSDLKVEAVLNGRTVQSSRTSELVFKVPEIIEMISRVMTLLPGDVIATGTPAGIGPMRPNDTITVFVEGVGRLTNAVEEERSADPDRGDPETDG